MSLLTLAEVKQGPVGRSCGIATTSGDFVNIVNDAVRQLMERGAWYGSVQPMTLTVGSDRTIICPRELASILAVSPSACPNQYPISTTNLWYQYLPWTDEKIDWLVSCRGRNTGRVAESIGYVVVTNQFTTANYIRVTSSSASDIGKSITFFGLDENSNPTSSTLSIAAPFATSFPQKFSRVDRVVKDLTAGYVTCQQDDNNGNLLPLSVYQPSEVSPQYVKVRLLMFNIAPGLLDVLARLSFIPALNDNDLVLIESQDAIRDMVLSIRKKEAGDLSAAAALERSAMLELNHQMRTRFPDEQFQVSFKPFGNDSMRNVHAGMI
jgi:hypothetical protein